jgi:hypothetical protein
MEIVIQPLLRNMLFYGVVLTEIMLCMFDQQLYMQDYISIKKISINMKIYPAE